MKYCYKTDCNNIATGYCDSNQKFWCDMHHAKYGTDCLHPIESLKQRVWEPAS